MNGLSEDRTVRLGTTRVRVRTAGDGDGMPLLMIMGLGGHLEMWQPLTEWLPGRRLVMFDFPGTGESSLSWMPPTMGFNAVFVRLLIRQLGLKRVDVLGYSWGGVLAQHLAIQHPRAVRRLVLAATCVDLGGIPPSPQVAVRMLTPRRYSSQEYFRSVAPKIYGGRFRTDAAVIEDHARLCLGRPPNFLGYAAQLAALSAYSTLPGLRFISARTLVLAGDDDPIVSTPNPRLLAAILRRSTLAIVPDAGHLFLLDSPDVGGPIITEFLSAK